MKVNTSRIPVLIKENNALTIPPMPFSNNVSVNDVTVYVGGDIVINAQAFVIEVAQITVMVQGIVNPLNNPFKLDITQPGICIYDDTQQYRLLILFDYFNGTLKARLDALIGNQSWKLGTVVVLWLHNGENPPSKKLSKKRPLA